MKKHLLSILIICLFLLPTASAEYSLIATFEDDSIDLAVGQELIIKSNVPIYIESDLNSNQYDVDRLTKNPPYYYKIRLDVAGVLIFTDKKKEIRFTITARDKEEMDYRRRAMSEMEIMLDDIQACENTTSELKKEIKEIKGLAWLTEKIGPGNYSMVEMVKVTGSEDISTIISNSANTGAMEGARLGASEGIKEAYRNEMPWWLQNITFLLVIFITLGSVGAYLRFRTRSEGKLFSVR